MGARIYIDSKKSLWVGSSQCSGYVSYGLLNESHPVISNDGAIGENDPFICNKIEEAAKKHSAVRVKETEFETVKLYKVPVYGQSVNIFNGDMYDIFGGEFKPTGYTYLSCSKYGKNKDRVIISFFDSYNEANGFHQF